MIYKATLKKPWLSPRGRFYPSGTIFTFSKRLKDINSIMYDFIAPGQGSGFVIFSGTIFKKLTTEEKYIRILRERLRNEHLKKSSAI
jgi:hypothetical protein